MGQKKQNAAVTVETLLSGWTGVEIEEHRVEQHPRRLSRFDHPAQLGDRHYQPYFQTDFSESMEELITAPHQAVRAVSSQLHSLQQLLMEQLHPDEVIWPLSMPPKLQPTDVTFLEKTFKRDWYQGYRDLLLAKYGPLQHIMCGVHVSYSPTPAIVNWYQARHQIADQVTAKNQLMFQITQELVGFRWLLTYLFGASPLDENQPAPRPLVRSLRASHRGFGNRADVHVSYQRLADFVNQQLDAIRMNKLFAPSEFYGPVRLKAKKGLASIPQQGIDYLELRTLDNDPFAADGIAPTTLRVVRLLILAGILFPEPWDAKRLADAATANDQVALAAPTAPLPADLQASAKQLVEQLQLVVKQLPNPADWQASLAMVHDRLQNPQQTTAGRLVSYVRQDSLSEFGFQRGLATKRARQGATLTAQFPDVVPALVPVYRYLAQTGIPFRVATPTKLVVTIADHAPITVTNPAQLAELQALWQAYFQ
ncbi:glutamate--cysteine ligase [Fructilactobacillus ixorae]|uniref:Glutamate--cysteine ligase n=1 Tax=Fructilactobacillus ixorae TaxID=1750535 RepID=A0ABY5C639_9LACO|nr:glutamate--cysteine ligase [Fructilactobacillus ixorae]USS93842.1 glutamate--cysteine ligase [Fructilactobacillus ixorae]